MNLEICEKCIRQKLKRVCIKYRPYNNEWEFTLHFNNGGFCNPTFVEGKVIWTWPLTNSLFREGFLKKEIRKASIDKYRDFFLKFPADKIIPIAVKLLDGKNMVVTCPYAAEHNIYDWNS